MKPAGIVLILIILNIFRKNKDTQKIFNSLLTLELFFACTRLNFGYFMMLGGMEIEYNDILLGLLFLFSLVYILQDPEIPRGGFSWSILLLFVIFIGVAMCYFDPVQTMVVDFNHSWDLYMRGYTEHMSPVHFSSQAILMSIRVIMFITILWVAEKTISTEEWLDQAKVVGKGLKWFLAYGVFEFVVKIIFKFPTNYFLMIIFGSGRATSYGMERLQGLSREPSYYALALFYMIVIFGVLQYFDSENKKSHRICICIAALLGAVSGAFTFVICIVAGVFILILLKYADNPRAQSIAKMVISVVMIAGMFMIFSSEFLNFAESSSNSIIGRMAESVRQLNNAFTGSYVLGEDYTSEASRFIGGIHSMKAGLLRPLVGLGIGTAYCTMGIPAIIANIGLGGLFVWLGLLFKEYGKIKNNLLILLVLLPAIVCGDLYTLYDTGYLLVLPLLGLVTSMGESYE